MTKRNRKPKENTGNNLHIEWEHTINQTHVMRRSLILRSITPITIYGDSTPFEWQGTYGTETIKISIPRQASEYDVIIPDNFPNEIDPERGSTRSQLRNEIKRVLRQLN